MKFRRIRFAIATSFLAVVPASALAQVPIYPNAPNAPTTLDPAATGNQTPPPAATPEPKRPGVVIVGPNGEVIGGDQQPAQNTYYVPGGSDDGHFGDGDGQPVQIHSGPTPDLHVVRTGDTLWDICWFYFNDPWQWPKIWSYNAQITNPHWIYPGDLVRLLPRGVFAQPTNQNDPEGSARVAQDPVPAPDRRVSLGIKDVAFVEKSQLDKANVLDGAVDEKAMLGAGDEVYLAYPKNQPPRVGERHTLYEPEQVVKNGSTEIGRYVRVLGEVEILSVRDDKRARAVITQSNREIERGAKTSPIVRRFANVAPTAPSVDAQGKIVAMLAADQLIGQGEVVFVALGQRSGLAVGNDMFVVRRGDAKPDTMSTEVGSDDRRFPARALGKIRILEVGEQVSIGLVTLSTEEMSVGDLVMMQKSAP